MKVKKIALFVLSFIVFLALTGCVTTTSFKETKTNETQEESSITDEDTDVITTTEEIITTIISSSTADEVSTIPETSWPDTTINTTTVLSITTPATDSETLSLIDDYYKNIDLNELIQESSSNIKSALHSLMTNTHTYFTTYDSIRYLYVYSDADPAKSGNIIGFYSHLSLNGTWNGGITYNREHVWPKSLGGFTESDPVGCDLHHIRPTVVSLNSDRGNKKYGDVSNGSVVKYNGIVYAHMNSDVFEPLDNVKGDCARIIFYVAIRYNMNLSLVVSDSTYKEILKWNEIDPVSEEEFLRNNYVESIQGNRNVFIDYPDLANYIWG